MKVICNRRSEGVVELVLNRPEQKNAIDFDVINQLQAHLQKIQEDQSISALILRGHGDAFCSGGDLNTFHNLLVKEEALTMLKPMSDVLRTIATLPKMTISYLTGPAVGGGAELACSTDYRFGTKNAKIGFIQGRLHITTGWGGASLLKRRIGMTNALRLLSTGKLSSMDEAMELGLIQGILNNIEELDIWTENLLSERVIHTYKQLLMPEDEVQSLFLAMDKEIDACATLWEKDEHHQAVKTFFENKNKG